MKPDEPVESLGRQVYLPAETEQAGNTAAEAIRLSGITFCIEGQLYYFCGCFQADLFIVQPVSQLSFAEEMN